MVSGSNWEVRLFFHCLHPASKWTKLISRHQIVTKPLSHPRLTPKTGRREHTNHPRKITISSSQAHQRGAPHACRAYVQPRRRYAAADAHARIEPISQTRTSHNTSGFVNTTARGRVTSSFRLAQIKITLEILETVCDHNCNSICHDKRRRQGIMCGNKSFNHLSGGRQAWRA